MSISGMICIQKKLVETSEKWPTFHFIYCLIFTLCTYFIFDPFIQ